MRGGYRRTGSSKTISRTAAGNLLDGHRFPVYLKKEFRNLLFCRAYETVGSLRGIGKGMGFKFRGGLNGPIRKMWTGASSISSDRLQSLAKLAKISDREVQRNIVSKADNQMLGDWFSELQEYQRMKNRGSPDSTAKIS